MKSRSNSPIKAGKKIILKFVVSVCLLFALQTSSVFAQYVKLRYITHPDTYGSNFHNRNVDVYIEFFSDAGCTVPMVTTNVSYVSIQQKFKEGNYNTSSAPSYTDDAYYEDVEVPSGTHSFLLEGVGDYFETFDTGYQVAYYSTIVNAYDSNGSIGIWVGIPDNDPSESWWNSGFYF